MPTKHITKENKLDVSVKSTKEQILAAYNTALTQLNEKQQENPQEQKQRQEKQVVIDIASKTSAETILQDLSNLKLKIIKQIEDLSENLMSESERLLTVRKAIILETNHLEELYQIKGSANSLAALIRANAAEQEKFDFDLTQKQIDLNEKINIKTEEWNKKQELLETEYKERKENLEKLRLREEEEYKYAQELTRRKETDEYLTKKTALEKELNDKKSSLQQREIEIKAKERLLQDLEITVTNFPEEMQKAIAVAEEKLSQKLELEHKFSFDLKAKEHESEVKLAQQRISHLENKVKEQEIQIKILNQKGDEALQQVQSIACRALDTSVQRIYTNNTEEKTAK